MSAQKNPTRQKLIDAALRLSAERGFSGISLREVAREAGITPAAFYRHFRDLNELGLELINEVGLGLRQMLRDARKNFDQRGSAVRSSVETFIQYITENANLFRLLQGERHGSSSEFRKVLFVEFNRFIEDIADALDRTAKEMNQPIEDSGLAAEAIVAVAFTVGGEALDLPKHRRGELIERIIKEIKIILRGSLRTRKPT